MKTTYILVHHYGTGMTENGIQTLTRYIGCYTTAAKRAVVREALVKQIAYPEDLEDVDLEME